MEGVALSTRMSKSSEIISRSSPRTLSTCPASSATLATLAYSVKCVNSWMAASSSGAASS